MDSAVEGPSDVNGLGEKLRPLWFLKLQRSAKSQMGYNSPSIMTEQRLVAWALFVALPSLQRHLRQPLDQRHRLHAHRDHLAH